MCCHVCEGAIAIIPIELIFTEVGDVQIYIAIVIVITDSGTSAVGTTSYTCLVGDISEGVITVVSVEDVMRGLVLSTSCLNRAIDEVDVEIAISIIIEKSTTRSEKFVEGVSHRFCHRYAQMLSLRIP